MSIKTVTADELRRMNGKEGLVLQGCGGDPQEWLDGINGLLTDEGILKNGSRFENISVFQNGYLTNISSPLRTAWTSTWASSPCGDCIPTNSSAALGFRTSPDRLGGFISEHEPNKTKPDCKLIGEDGNIYNLMGLAARTLRKNGLTEQATEMTERITACGSYDEALCIIGEYVNITDGEEYEDENEGMGMRL